MVILRMKELRKMDERDLDKHLKDLRLELSKERANIHIGASVTSPGRIKEIRRTISRILTVKEERKRKK
jgi:large subunit ribosomal protein L29